MNSPGKLPESTAWNPGLDSEIPARLWPLVTMFREENSSVSYAIAAELADLTGLDPFELAALKPQRLVIHALLVRVTADLSVPDGPNYEDLGINLRSMVDAVYSRHVVDQMPIIQDKFDAARESARKYLTAEIGKRLFQVGQQQEVKKEKQTIFQRLFGKSQAKSEPVAVNEQESALRAINDWQKLSRASNDPLEKSCLEVLIRIVGKVIAHRGRLLLDQSQLTELALNQIGNTYGYDVVNLALEPFWQEAIAIERFRELPAQESPVVMNVKGASASGKSTIRPSQRLLAEKLGIPWEDFALISPDYWRKYLLDYSSLGDDFKYGAMLTGRELEIIDGRLDRHMAQKASKRRMSHLLIDRFRFDSFTVDIDRKPDSRLLSRFGDVVYLFFMVTHPAETVERAWLRGQTTGRYKAVDDLLYHNVEAFTGMPSLFLSWVNSQDRKVHFEFLDNNVPLGDLPKTAAFGWNGSMTILDVKLLINIDQYRLVNVAANNRNDVFGPDLTTALPTPEFIVKCVEKVGAIVFADQSTGAAYASILNGELHWIDRDYVSRSDDQTVIRHVLSAIGDIESDQLDDADRVPAEIQLATEQRVTVGRWG